MGEDEESRGTMLITNGESKSLIVRNAASAIWGNGIACLCLAALLFAVAAALVKTMASTGVPTFQIVCIRSGCCLLISYFSAKAGGIPFLYGSTKNYPLLAVRGTIGAAAMSVFYFAIPRLPLADSTTIMFSNPAITAILGWIFLKEHFGFRTSIGCLAASVGVLLVAQPPFIIGLLTRQMASVAWTRERAIGMCLAITGATLSSAVYILIRVIGKRESALTVAAWFHTVSTISSAVPLMLGVPQRAVLPSLITVIRLASLVLCSFTAQLLMSRGVQIVPASKAAAMNYSQVVYSFVFGILFFSDVVSILGVCGSIIIAAAILLIHSDEKHPPEGGVSKWLTLDPHTGTSDLIGTSVELGGTGRKQPNPILK